MYMLGYLKDGNYNSNFSILALIKLGSCYRDSGNLEKSLSLLEEAVAISRSCYSSSHPLLANGKKS